MIEAVASGRIVRDSSPRSTKVYISFSTMSVVCADRALEELRLLQDGEDNLAEPEIPEYFPGLPLHVLPFFRFARQDVLETP